MSRHPNTTVDLLALYKRVVEVHFDEDYHLLCFNDPRQGRPTWVYTRLPHVSAVAIRPADSVWLYVNEKALLEAGNIVRVWKAEVPGFGDEGEGESRPPEKEPIAVARQMYPGCYKRHSKEGRSDKSFLEFVLRVETLRQTRYPFCPMKAWDVIQEGELFDTYMGEPLFGYLGVPVPEWASERERWERDNLVDDAGWSTPEVAAAQENLRLMAEALNES